MRRIENKIYVDAIKAVVLMVLALLLCRVTRGAGTLLIAGAGMWFAMSRRIGVAICCYGFLIFCVIVNPYLVTKAGSLWSWGLRFGPLAVGLSLVIASVQRVGNHYLPFVGILPFLLCAIVSSSVGYVPPISYMKLVNYFVFLIGLWLGTRNIQQHPRDVLVIRAFFLGMVFLLVWGSLALIPFPGISYATSLSAVMKNGGMEAASYMARQMLLNDDQILFCGITNHSQALSPILALSMAWLLCDMLFVERRLRWPHGLTLVAMLPMLYMTRSRVALLTGGCALAMISFYTVNRIQVGRRVKQSLRKGTLLFVVLTVAMAAVAEIRDQSITKWIRKTNDIEADQREVSEAFTGSRQGLIEESMHDFSRNPMWGSGFQVAEYTQELWQHSNGLVFSASIEKGVLPVMILGETGIAGGVTFAFFLLSFYFTCKRKRLFVTATMFTLLLITNMGEATFFSPGGIGGILWVLSVLGGFVIDTELIYGNRSMAVTNWNS